MNDRNGWPTEGMNERTNWSNANNWKRVNGTSMDKQQKTALKTLFVHVEKIEATHKTTWK